jgi:hypothetical protein
MALGVGTLVPISGPKKVSISGPTPSKAPRYGLLPHANPYVPPHINNRYINSYKLITLLYHWPTHAIHIIYIADKEKSSV